jgi:hypothetical protein
MTAKELIKLLRKAIAENGKDLEILIVDSETSWFDTIKEVKVIQPTKWNYLERPGVELIRGER